MSGGKVLVGTGVSVGGGGGVLVGVSVGTAVNVGVIDGPRGCPGPQADANMPIIIIVIDSAGREEKRSERIFSPFVI
jgi:hypothetical protein